MDRSVSVSTLILSLIVSVARFNGSNFLDIPAVRYFRRGKRTVSDVSDVHIRKIKDLPDKEL